MVTLSRQEAPHFWDDNFRAVQVKGVLCAALYPHVAVMDDSAGKTSRPTWHDGTSDIFIHPSSVNHMLDAQQFLRPYLVFLEKVITFYSV
jgi:hypothetical protein